MMVAVLPLLVTDTGFVLNEQVGAGETGGEIEQRKGYSTCISIRRGDRDSCRELPPGLTGDGLGEPAVRV
jgi:hypothetical protein